MGRSTADAVFDAGLNHIKDNCDKMVLCATQPTTFAEANNLDSGSGKKLAEVAMVSGDFTLANGDVSGRKVTVAAKSGTVIATENGDGDHVALLDTVNSVLLHVTEMPSQTLTGDNPFNTQAWDYELRDPVAPA